TGCESRRGEAGERRGERAADAHGGGAHDAHERGGCIDRTVLRSGTHYRARHRAGGVRAAVNAVIADRYRLEAAFPPSDAQRERAIGMWMQEQVFPDLQQATRRAEQLVVLLNRDDGGLAGVAT